MMGGCAFCSAGQRLRQPGARATCCCGGACCRTLQDAPNPKQPFVQEDSKGVRQHVK